MVVLQTSIYYHADLMHLSVEKIANLSILMKDIIDLFKSIKLIEPYSSLLTQELVSDIDFFTILNKSF